jgi:sodium transport system permease protein
MRRIWVIFRKEVLDNLRDRRSISSSLLTPVFMPIFLIALIMVVGKSLIRETIESPLNLPVMGAEYAPDLIAFLKMNNVRILPAPADPRAAVREGEVNLVMLVSEDYSKDMGRGGSAVVDVVLDTSRQSASADVQRLRGLLLYYEGVMGNTRLQARGISPGLTNVLTINTIDTATPQSQSIIFLNMMPFLLIMTIFLGGMYVVIDATAGERERGSLEPLLINPVYRREFVIGKFMASLPFALFSLALTLLLFWIGFNVVPLEEYVGFKMTINQDALWNIFWLCVPMVLMASAMQMLVATFTRSFKEAQTYLSFLPLIFGLPGAFLGFLPVKSNMTAMLMPTYGQSLLINQFLRGETIQPNHILVVSIATLFLALILILVSIRLYGREAILFGR